MRAEWGMVALLVAICTVACDRGGQAAGEGMTWEEHAARQQVDLAVAYAINEKPADYARAVDVIRRSDRPDDVKSFEIGQLVVGSYNLPDTKRPPETMQQGLAMMERAGMSTGETRDPAQQQLRMMFERGYGPGSSVIPIDKPVADCWHRLELGQPGDPARCVALRRQRLPRFSG